MKKLLAALVLLALLYPCAAGCGPAPLCRTRCGLELEFVPQTESGELSADPSWTCENLQRTEDQIVESFQAALDLRFKDACNRIRGEGIYVVGSLSWESSGRRVAGETFCANRYVFVYSREPWNIALAHELAHVVQACSPLDPIDSRDEFHSNWVRDDIHSVVQDVKDKMVDAGVP